MPPQYIDPHAHDEIGNLQVGEFALPILDNWAYEELAIAQNSVGAMRTNMIQSGISAAANWVPPAPGNRDLENLQNEINNLISEIVEEDEEPANESLVEIFHRIQLWGGNTGRNIYVQGGWFNENFRLDAYRKIFALSINEQPIQDKIRLLRTQVQRIQNWGLAFASKHVSFFSAAANAINPDIVHLPIFDSRLSEGCFGRENPIFNDYISFSEALNGGDVNLEGYSVRQVERTLFNFFSGELGSGWIARRIGEQIDPEPPGEDAQINPDERPSLLLNQAPRYYIGIQSPNNPATNIGYISRTRRGRGGEICVYRDLADLLQGAGYDGVLLGGNMQHGGPNGRHAGNISMPPGQNNPESAIEFLGQWFNIIDPG